MFATILIATDATSTDETIYRCAERLALRDGSKVVVVVVGAASSVGRRVHQQIRQLRERGVHARLAVVADGRDEASVIAHLARAWGADLVMVGDAESGVDSALNLRIVEASSCPVLTVPRAGRSALRFRPQQAGFEGVVDEVGAG